MSSTAEAVNGSPKKIEIPAINTLVVEVPIVGLSPGLICHAWPDKIKRQLAEIRSTDQSTQPKQGKNSKKRAVRDFHQEYLDSLYPIDGEAGAYGFPAVAFKRAIVGACRQVSNLSMTLANRLVFVYGSDTSKGTEVVRINGTPQSREDMVRLSGADRPADIRYRAEFVEWTATLTVEFNAAMISIEGVYNLIQNAGWSEGIGEQRPSAPEKPFNNGRFRLASKGD